MMSLINDVLKWRYVNVIYVVAVQMQMGINISQNMLLIFDMEEYYSRHTQEMNQIVIFKENQIGSLVTSPIF
jgi:hypothetical protein